MARAPGRGEQRGLAVRFTGLARTGGWGWALPALGVVTQPPRGSVRAMNQERHREDSVPGLGPARGQNRQKAAVRWTWAAVTVKATGQGLTRLARMSHRSGAHGQSAIRVGSSPASLPGLRLLSMSSRGLSSGSSGDTALVSRSLFLSPQPCLMAYGVLVHQPGSKPGPSALKAGLAGVRGRVTPGGLLGGQAPAAAAHRPQTPESLPGRRLHRVKAPCLGSAPQGCIALRGAGETQTKVRGHSLTPSSPGEAPGLGWPPSRHRLPPPTLGMGVGLLPCRPRPSDPFLGQNPI